LLRAQWSRPSFRVHAWSLVAACFVLPLSRLGGMQESSRRGWTAAMRARQTGESECAVPRISAAVRESQASPLFLLVQCLHCFLCWSRPAACFPVLCLRTVPVAGSQCHWCQWSRSLLFATSRHWHRHKRTGGGDTVHTRTRPSRRRSPRHSAANTGRPCKRDLAEIEAEGQARSQQRALPPSRYRPLMVVRRMSMGGIQLLKHSNSSMKKTAKRTTAQGRFNAAVGSHPPGRSFA
jgi:hypothetical protein